MTENIKITIMVLVGLLIYFMGLAIGSQSKGDYVCILKEQKGWVYTNNAEDCGAIKNVLNNIENI